MILEEFEPAVADFLMENRSRWFLTGSTLFVEEPNDVDYLVLASDLAGVTDTESLFELEEVDYVSDVASGRVDRCNFIICKTELVFESWVHATKKALELFKFHQDGPDLLQSKPFRYAFFGRYAELYIEKSNALDVCEPT